MSKFWKRVLFLIVSVMMIESFVRAGSDTDGTKHLDLSVGAETTNQVIIGQDFTMTINITNADTSEGDAYNPGVYLRLPFGVGYAGGELGTPIQTLMLSGGESVLFFEMNDIIVQGGSQEYDIVLTSATDAPLFTASDIQLGAYAEDSIYGRGSVPSGAPAGTDPGGVDIANTTTDPSNDFPSDITTGSVLTLPRESAQVTFVPYDIIKEESGEMLIGNMYTTTLSVIGNDMGPLSDLVITDVLPTNRKFVGFTQTGGVGSIDVQYNVPVDGQVTLVLSDVNVSTGATLNISYQTLALAYDIQQYVGTGIVLDTSSFVANESPTPNTATLMATGTWVDADLAVQSVATPVTKTAQPLIMYETFVKSVNGGARDETVVVGDTVSYTLTLTAAENVRYVSGTTIEDALPDGLAFQLASLTVSNPSIVLTSSTTDSEGLTTLVFTLTTGSIVPGAVTTIGYDALVDNNFEGSGDDEYENTEEITNTATFSGVIGDSGQSQEWGYTDPAIIGDIVTYTDSATIVAPEPTSSKHLLSIKLPDGTIYDNTNPINPTTIALPPDAEVTFAVVMDFPNVHTTGALLKDFLPLIMGPHTDTHDISFVSSGTTAMDGTPILANDGDGDTVADAAFNGLVLGGTTVADTSWITTEPANTLVFTLGEFTGARTFAIQFTANVRPTKPSGYDNEGSLPQKNISLGYFNNGEGQTNILGFETVNFSLAAPALDVSKSTTTSRAAYGDTVPYQIILTNSGKSPAYLDPLIDTVPAGMQYVTGSVQAVYGGTGSSILPSIITQSGTELSISFNTSGPLSRSVVPTDLTGTTYDESTIIVSYDLSPTVDFTINNTDKTNTVSADYFSSETATGGINNFGPVEAESSIRATLPTITRTLISTSESDSGDVNSNGEPDLLVGEEATFETVITLPGGTYENASFYETLHSYMEFITGSVVSMSGSISFSGVDTFNASRRVLFDTITNTDSDPSTIETIVIRTQERVRDDNAVQSVGNRGIYTRGIFYFGGTNRNTYSYLDIILPSITLTKTATPSINLNASSPTTFDLTITNSGLATGYNISLQDVLPATLSLSGSVGGSVDRSTPLTDLFSSGIMLDVLAPGTSETVTFQATTAADAKAGSIHINTGSIAYSTLDGIASPYERTLTGTDTASVTIDDLSISHSIASTSYTGTSSTDVVIGEEVAYDIMVDVPQVIVSGAVLTQSLPAGVVFLSASVIGDQVASDESSPIISTGSNTISIDRGDIINTGAGAGTGLTVRTVLRVDDITSNMAGISRVSTATIDYDTTNTKTQTQPSRTIREPALLMTKAFATQQADGGQSIGTTLTVTNTGSAIAYDIRVSDLLPPKTSGNGAYQATHTIASLAPGASWTHTYQTILGTDVIYGETLIGTGRVDEYSSLPGAQTGERMYDQVVDTDYVQILDGEGLAKTLTTAGDDEKRIGDTITYDILVTIPEGQTPSLEVTDTLPDGLTYITGGVSAPTSLSGDFTITPTVAGQQITRSFGQIENLTDTSASEDITITLEARIANTSDTNRGDSKTNNIQADLASGAQILTGIAPPVTIIEPSVAIDITSSYTYGNRVTYTYTLTNTGTAAAYDIVVPTQLPAGLSYDTSSLSGQDVVLNGTTFSLSALSPNPGNPSQFTIDAIIDASVADQTSLTVTAPMTYTSQPGTNAYERTGVGGVDDYSVTSSDTFTVLLPLLDETLIVDQSTGEIGDTFTYTFTLTNTGSVDLTAIDVAIPLSNTLTGWTSGDLTLSGDQFVLSGVSLAIGQTTTYTFVGIAPLTTPDMTAVTTIATVSNTPEGAVGGQPTASMTILAPTLTSTITQTDQNGGQLLANETITNTATIGNTGSITGANVVLTITLSPGETFVPGSITVGSGSTLDPSLFTYDDVTRTLTVTMPALAVGATEVIVFDTTATGPSNTDVITTIGAVSDRGITTDAVADPLTIGAPVSGSSGGGGTFSRAKDDCPDGDYTRSRYDGSCGQADTPIETDIVDTTIDESVDQEVFNPVFAEYQCHELLDETTIYQGNSVSDKFRTAHQMLYSYELTRWRGTADFAPNRQLTRQEAARFMVEFAINVLCRKPTYTYTNQFTDIVNADPTLIPYIKQSYEYKIFHGDGGGASRGEPTTFRPFDLISYDELVAVMVRLVTNEYNEVGGVNRADSYKTFMQSRIEKTTTPNNQRSNVAETIYDLYRRNQYNREEIGFVIEK